MKKHFLFFAVLALFAAAGRVAANTNYVVAGADFQAAINASAPGDTLIVQAGSYPDNVVFSNPITVLCSGTNAPATNILFQGTVQIQGTGPMYFAQCQFLDNSTMLIQGAGSVSFAQCQFLPALQISRSGTVSFNQCQSYFSGYYSFQSTNANILASNSSFGNCLANLSISGGTNLQAFDSTFNSLIGISGKITLKRCVLSSGMALSSNCAFEGLRLTNSGPTSAIAGAGAEPTFIAVQSSLAGPIAISGYNLWLGYDSMNSGSPYSAMPTLATTNCNTAAIGNVITATVYGNITPSGVILAWAGCWYSQGGSLRAYNNLISGNAQTGGSSVCYGFAIFGIYVNSTSASIINNTIRLYGEAYCAGIGYESCIVVTNQAAPSTLIGDIIQAEGSGSLANGISGFVAINDSSYQGINALYCDVVDSGGSTGVNLANCISVDPQLNGGFTPNIGSPCLGGGPPDATYYNRGTTNRDDIGWTGGPYCNFGNNANNSPMVFFLSGSPLTVFKGQQTSILVNVAASAGQ